MVEIKMVRLDSSLARAIAAAATEGGGCANCLGHGKCMVRVRVGEGGKVEAEGECANGCTTGEGLVTVALVTNSAQTGLPEEWLM